MNKPFILVASYPKSGNTWTRIVFDRLRRGTRLSINDIDSALAGHSRRIFDDIAPVNAGDLLPEEIRGFLPRVYRKFAETLHEKTFIKVHEWACQDDYGWLYPPECVDSVIYLVRHPFDVAVSMAHFFDLTVETVVEAMGSERGIPLATTWLPGILPLAYGSWSRNVLSWLDAEVYRLAWARYEDLHADPVPSFMRLAKAAGLGAEQADVARVVEVSRFELLKQEEAERGFREKPVTSPAFFRAGRPRSWEGVLTLELRERILRDHGPVMARLGYTDDGGILPLSANG